MTFELVDKRHLSSSASLGVEEKTAVRDAAGGTEDEASHAIMLKVMKRARRNGFWLSCDCRSEGGSAACADRVNPHQPRRQPGEGPGRVLDTDLAFAGEAWSWVGDALPLLTASSDLQSHALARRMRAGFFSVSDDVYADSWERQCTVFEQEALHLATRLVCSDDEARCTSITPIWMAESISAHLTHG